MLKFKHTSQESGPRWLIPFLADHLPFQKIPPWGPSVNRPDPLLLSGSILGHVYVVQAKEKQRNAFLSIAQNINLSQEPSKDSLAKE